jgi:hypothetical protein
LAAAARIDDTSHACWICQFYSFAGADFQPAPSPPGTGGVFLDPPCYLDCPSQSPVCAVARGPPRV